MRNSHRLTALRVAKTTKPGLHHDGHGLYLRVKPSGAKSWLFRFMRNRRARKLGLGPVHTVSLADARELALQARKALRAGVDPIEERNAAKVKARLDAARAVPFGECAAAYIRAHRAGWRNTKHAGQWVTTIATYVEPVIGALPVQAIDTALVLKVLEPVWSVKPETASRVRGRIESILDWAAARGYRPADNPARWRGHLDKLLPARRTIMKVKHHAALPFEQMPTFMAELRAHDGVSARALELAILTAARTGEIIRAQRTEFNLDTRIWIIPAERMKGGREHRVPLSDIAVAIINQMPADGVYLFAGARVGAPLSKTALLDVLLRMGRKDLTVHGFRSTFRDWGGEQTAFPNEMLEIALAHAVSNKVEAAYRRRDMMEKRRRLMAEWAAYCAAPAAPRGNVVSIRHDETAAAS